MKLSKALRLKNTLASDIKILTEKIKKYNSINVKNSSPWDVNALFNELQQKRFQIINIKTAIAKINTSIYEKIYQLDELKSEIAFLQSLDCTNGISVTRSYDGGEQTDEFSATINEQKREEFINNLKTNFERIQDELNTFNFTTEITF